MTGASPQPQPRPADPAADPVLVDLARAMLRGRRLWPQWLGPLPTGDPGWAILLELFVARRAYERVTVGDVATLLGIPSTTSLRYIDELQRRGHLDRRADPDDRRRVYLEISPASELSIVAALRDFRRLFEGALRPAN